MGTITTGVGLYSGINYADLVDKLISIDARPRDLLKNRVSTLDTQKAAYAQISARITALWKRASVHFPRKSRVRWLRISGPGARRLRYCADSMGSIL